MAFYWNSKLADLSEFWQISPVHPRHTLTRNDGAGWERRNLVSGPARVARCVTRFPLSQCPSQELTDIQICLNQNMNMVSVIILLNVPYWTCVSPLSCWWSCLLKKDFKVLLSKLLFTCKYVVVTPFNTQQQPELCRICLSSYVGESWICTCIVGLHVFYL